MAIVYVYSFGGSRPGRAKLSTRWCSTTQDEVNQQKGNKLASWCSRWPQLRTTTGRTSNTCLGIPSTEILLREFTWVTIPLRHWVVQRASGNFTQTSSPILIEKSTILAGIYSTGNYWRVPTLIYFVHRTLWHRWLILARPWCAVVPVHCFNRTTASPLQKPWWSCGAFLLFHFLPVGKQPETP